MWLCVSVAEEGDGCREGQGGDDLELVPELALIAFKRAQALLEFLDARISELSNAHCGGWYHKHAVLLRCLTARQYGYRQGVKSQCRARQYPAGI
jgi:hypothetical protein